MSQQFTLWTSFNIFIALMLVLDLFVFNRKAGQIKIKTALLWTGFWMLLAGLFCLGIYLYYPADRALRAQEFATGYLIEQSLSFDNLFVIMLIFNFFNTPVVHQHKVLFWGIIGAIVFRTTFILAGITIINQFTPMLYILGAFLIYTAIRMLLSKDEEVHPDKNIGIRLLKKILPVSNTYDEGKFTTRQNGKLYATPLLIALMVVETTDIVFAVDSIPAVIAISKDSFIIYSSNIFAILGLRSLYFALAGMMELFRFLKVGLSIILIFIGAKIILDHANIIEIPSMLALLIVAGILALSVIFSIIFPSKKETGN